MACRKSCFLTTASPIPPVAGIKRKASSEASFHRPAPLFNPTLIGYQARPTALRSPTSPLERIDRRRGRRERKARAGRIAVLSFALLCSLCLLQEPTTAAPTPGDEFCSSAPLLAAEPP